MEAQYVHKESYSSVIVLVLMGKIPEVIGSNMIRFGSNHLKWNLEGMLAALGKEIEVLEGHVPVLQNGPSGGRRGDQQTRSKFSELKPTTESALLAGNAANARNRCGFCSKIQSSEDCEVYKTLEEHKKILIEYGRCFGCLKPGHRAKH